MTTNARAFCSAAIVLASFAAAAIAYRTAEPTAASDGGVDEPPTMALPVANDVASDVASAAEESVPPDDSEIHWYADLAEARKASKETGKAIFLDFGHDGCRNCLALDKVLSGMAAEVGNYVPLRVNRTTPEGKAIAKDFQMGRFDPCHAFEWPDGMKARFPDPLREISVEAMLNRFHGAEKFREKHK